MNCKDNKQIFEEWNSKSLFKDSFYNSHKEQIDKYKRARVILEKITGSSAIKSKNWQRDIQSFEIEITKLNKQAQSIKEEYENINHIKYAAKTVNDDYGIDLSIEIDKAIKRGEKPSVIEQIKKYQEQQENMSRGKEKQKIIIGMRKGSDFLKKSGIISIIIEYRLENCRFDISKNIGYALVDKEGVPLPLKVEH